jgi:hypothetical protein
MVQIPCVSISLTRKDPGLRVYEWLQDTDDDPAPSEDWVQAM